MLIVDGQIHLWEKGTPSAHHRIVKYIERDADFEMPKSR
jgi:hypothetical protein